MTKIASGQSIIEVVIAATLISIGMVAALSLSNYSTRQNTYAKYINQTTSYNNQAGDWLRSEKARLGWNQFAAKLTGDGGPLVTYCLPNADLTGVDFLTLNAGNCGAADLIPNTFMTRSLSFDLGNIGNGKINLTVTTSWTDKTTHNLSLTMEISQWK